MSTINIYIKEYIYFFEEKKRKTESFLTSSKSLKEYQYRNEIKTNFKFAQKLIHGKMCNMYILKENISI